jgi:uncharacterized protein with HEPN domain
MRKDNSFYLTHILEAIKSIEEYTDGYSYDDFIVSKKTQDAVIRNFEIIGEAANNLDEDFITTHSAVAWEKLVSMRNLLIHEYFGVDLDIVWDTIQEDVPELKEKLVDILH